MYTEADLADAAAKVSDARQRIEVLTIEIELARQRGKPSQVAEEMLVSMLTTLNHMIDREKAVKAALVGAR
jgi:hypothetical protein